MINSDAMLAALAELMSQNRELAQRVAALESAQSTHHERINAHGLLLTAVHKTEALREYVRAQQEAV